MTENPFEGTWSYRSLLNDPHLDVPFDDLRFGQGTLVIEPAPMQRLAGTLGGPGWRLQLQGSRGYGDPMTLRFQGNGLVNGEEWIYDYEGYLVPHWPNGIQQRPAIVGSIVRTIPHASKSGVSPAGVVASWYAVRQDD